MRINDLRTPAFLVDLERVRRNASMMQEQARRLGVRLRPHVKTHKTVEGARIQTESGFPGITVSTLAEARFFREAGFQDILYAFPISADKLPEVVHLNDGASLHILADHPRQIDWISDHGLHHSTRFSVFLKVDAGYHRAGVDPAAHESITLARRMQESSVIDFAGILTHAGQSYDSRGPAEIREYSHAERDVMAGFARILRENGIPCPIVSVASTPTAVQADNLDGIDEIRPGNYLFFDKFQADIGNCALEHCAMSVLTRVVSSYPEPEHLLIDAGALAFSKDPGATHIDTEVTYGAVMGRPDLHLTGLSQEHGIIRPTRPDIGLPELGELLRIIPNHSCLTAACFPVYHVVKGNEVVDEWTPVRGW